MKKSVLLQHNLKDEIVTSRSLYLSGVNLISSDSQGIVKFLGIYPISSAVAVDENNNVVTVTIQ